MNYTVLIAGSIVLVLFSWFVSIREKRFHGITRFFSFECIFILFLLNVRIWFHDVFSFHQIISWTLLIASIYPVLAGFISLKRKGRSESNFENTTVLVKSGIYKYIRHPLYCSLLLLGTGIMFKDLNTLKVILGAINMVAVYLTAIIEEKEMLTKFGSEYEYYMKETKMFFPLVF